MTIMPKDIEKPVDERDVRIGELETKLDSLTKLIREREGVSSKPVRIAEKVSKMMFVDDEPVVAFGQAMTAPNGQITIAVTTVNEAGEKNTKELEYLPMLNNNPRYSCEMLSQEATKTVHHQGPIPVKFKTRMADSVAQRTSTGEEFVSREMILEHTQVSYVAKVRFLEGPWSGKELSVETSCLNP
jgi:hypothetical protein